MSPLEIIGLVVVVVTAFSAMAILFGIILSYLYDFSCFLFNVGRKIAKREKEEEPYDIAKDN